MLKAFANTVDGQLQTFAAKDGRYNREHFFGQNPALASLAQGLTDEQIDRLKRGGHDLVKIYAAYHAATQTRAQPTVILAQTKKGYGMGSAGQGRMTTHQQKKLDRTDLIAFRNRFQLPLRDEEAAELTFYKPAPDSQELRYLHAQRSALGGYLPTRQTHAEPVPVPALPEYAQFALQADSKELSTTLAFVRMLTALLRDKQLTRRIVPIVADEARTFGMANLFRQVGIYSSHGQRYEPEDIDSVLSYREALDGQILEEGISEAGALASWTAAATSYSAHGIAMLPFYIFYSMFGFQRVGDQIWAAADQRARGFLLGATSGRTTLGGEGLQHQDGSSLLHAALVPSCRAYDPCFAYELAVILDYGMRRMLQEQRDELYYITLMNESYAQPSLPEGVQDDIIRGLYRVQSFGAEAPAPQLRLIGSGAILREVLAAAELLTAELPLCIEVFCATSYSELAREARACERDARLSSKQASAPTQLARCLPGTAPIIAASDYVRAWPQLIASYLRAPFYVLGTDGFGRSDTRAALRSFFEVDRAHIALTALSALRDQGQLDNVRYEQMRQRLGIDVADSAGAPWET